MPTWTRATLPTATIAQQRDMDFTYASQFFKNEDDAAAFKAKKTADYLESFDRYAWSMDNRPGTAGPPPVPAYAMIVTGDASSWSELVQSPTERVCATKTYTPTPKPVPGRGKIGKRYSPRSNFFVCLPGDTTESGEEVPGTSEDGVFGVFLKIGQLQGSGATVKGAPVVGVWELQLHPE